VIQLIAVVFYVAALLLWLRAFLTGTRGRAVRVPGAVAAVGVAVHFLSLAFYTYRWGELPLVGLAPSLSTLSFLIGLALVATLFLGEASRVGVLLLPLMVLLQGVATMLGVRPAAADLDFRGAWFAFHVMLGLAGVGGMALAGASGALYLVQFRELKSKRLGKLFQFLPPLATLDRLGRIGVVFAFTTLTLAILLGWAWTLDSRQTLAGGSPQTIWAVFMWAVILAVLVVRARSASAERRSAVASLVGFGLIAASYLVLRATASTGALFL